MACDGGREGAGGKPTSVGPDPEAATEGAEECWAGGAKAGGKLASDGRSAGAPPEEAPLALAFPQRTT